MRKNKTFKSVLTLVLVFMLVFETIAPTAFSVLGVSAADYIGGNGTVSDLDTSTKYTLSLGDNASTEYAGRVWTDKSVYTGDATFETFGGGSVTVNLDEQKGEDFLVAYSALATSESVSGQAKAPVDVVLILDISGSMSNSDSNMDNGYSRIYNSVQAVNNAIDTLMDMNEHTRVAVVAFSSTAQTLLPLGRYETTTTVERGDWVQTGTFPWQGYYEEVVVEQPYFSLSRNTGSDNNATLYTNVAIEGTDDKISKSTSVSGGTNIQMGLHQGMNILATEDETTVDVNGSTIQRVPSVVLLSDGAPTYSSSSDSWWAPDNNEDHGPGSGPYAGNGFKAILTGAYMKEAVNRNYGVAGTAYATKVYTIGMGIEDLSESEKNLARITLDPEEYWDNANITNSMKTAIKGYWTDYTDEDKTSVTINVGRRNGNRTENRDVTIGHPDTGYDVDFTSGWNYVDAYSGAQSASTLASVFEAIVSSISISAPQVPTEMKGTDPLTDGYITYTDPIGKYMQVKDVKSIIYAGHEYTQKTVNNGTYVFNDEVHSPIYGDQNLDDIIITVTTAANGDQTLVIKIPASVIPLRVNEVTLNADGTVKTHTNNGAYPARVVYSVGMNPEIVKYSDSGKAYIDGSIVDPDYLANNTNADGTVNFYSNLYTNTNVVNGMTAGDATVEFEPAHNNQFYYILEDVPIYKDSEFKNQVTASEGLDDNTTYYYKEEFYHGASVEVLPIARTGVQLKKTTINTCEDGYLYRAAGSPRTNRILEFEGTKVRNATDTATDFYAPTFRHADGSTDPYEGKFVIYHGNNGLATFSLGGNLQITKTVNAAAGLTAPDKTFKFTIDLDGSNVNQGEYRYVITDLSGAKVSEGTISKNSPDINLKDGQTATVYGLPPETEYTVTESAVSGFTSQSDGATGTIKVGKTSVAAFTNTYNVTPVTFPANGNFSGIKRLEGRKWANGDSFTFIINNYNNAPLPDKNTVTVTKPDTTGGTDAAIEFGEFEFTKPGVYRYTIYEQEPENDHYLNGMSYSSALYRLVVTVVDNGDGTLSVDTANTEIQKLYQDDATPLFTYDNDNQIVMNAGEEAPDDVVFVNTFEAGSVIRVPAALKDYTDNSGQNSLVSGMFSFKFEAVGYSVDGGAFVNDKSKVPMPEGAVNGAVITENEGRNITFESVEFKQSDIPAGADSITFRYNMSEVVPANKIHGMDYDDTVYTINVTVSVDAESGTLVVNSVYPNNERVVTFKNEYTPDPVTADILGTKTLNGRNMQNGEFEFTLMGGDAATNLAIRNGEVTIPDDTVSAPAASDGVAGGFTFDDIKFTKAGTYTFTVSEAEGQIPAITYDKNTVNVTVIIDDENKDGKLEVKSVTYSNGKSQAEFTNTYTANFVGTGVSLAGEKQLTGKTLLEGEFFFNVVQYVDGVKVGEGLVTHAKDTDADTNDVYSGAITFLNDVKYTAAGVYEYIISEQIPDDANKVGGTTYDTTSYRYTVTVQDVGFIGELKVTDTKLEVMKSGGWTEHTGDVVFSNTYDPKDAEAELPLIKKVLAGERSTPLAAGEFDFELTVVSESVQGGIVLPANTIVSNAADGKVVFDKIKFTKAGTYTVKVKEIIPEDAQKKAGVKYSTHEVIVTYTVVDDRIGELVATVTQVTGGPNIVNTYTATPDEVEIEITKNLSGRGWLPTDKFDFEVVVLDPDTIKAIEDGRIEFPLDEGSGEIATKTIDTEGESITGKIKVNLAGTYKFIVREVTGNIAGIYYDPNPREVTIVATDNPQTAEIETEVTVMKGATPITGQTIEFINIYAPNFSALSGHDNLWVKKNFTGRENDEWLDTDSFEFKLEPADSATELAIFDHDISIASSRLTVTNDNKAHAHFGTIIFYEAGKYTFKISEIQGNIPGVTYDTAPRIITVDVVDNTQKGALEASIVAGESDELVFNNTYKAEPATLVGSTNLAVTKSVIGRDWFTNDSFKFVLSPFGQVAQDAISNGDIVMPASDTVTITYDSTDVPHGKTAAFGDIIFKKAGTYIFDIDEEKGNAANVTYDSHTQYVVVTVTDNYQTGKFDIAVEKRGSSVFVNTYTPDPVEVPVDVMKEISGDRTLGADEFEFSIIAVTAGAPLPTTTNAKNDANGKVDFGKIKFTAENAGHTYVYTVTELPSSIAGITNDNKPVTVTVEVDYNSVQGKLSYTAKYEKDGKVGKTFVNTYKAAASEPVSITATKKVTASDGNNYKLESGKFWFTIEGSTGAPMPSVTRVTCDENGNIDFGEIVFETKGDYEYTIREEAGNIGQMTYDGAVYTFKVKVTNNVTIGKLETETSLKKDNANANAIVFTNDYNPKKTSAVIFGKKTLDSEHKNIESGEFKFKLSAVSAGTPMPDQDTVTNTASGAFQFGTIEYTKVGVYKYTVTEVDLDKYGYEYDGKSYDITVTVTDDNNGQLVSSVDGIGTLNAPTVQFVNKYAPDPVEVTIGDKGELVKDLDGRDMNDKEFEFVLTDSNDVEIGTAKNNKKGEFEFTFEITKAGTHKYTLTEKDNGLGGVSYDKRTYDVTVEVVDKDGKLEVRDVKFALENAPKDKVVFENTYTAEKTHIILKAVKTLKNRTLKSGEFKFILKDKDGKVVSTAVNDENGDITFDRIEYTEKGEYKYTVTEEIGTLDGITYDRSEYAVNVEVTDDGKGKLGVSKTVITKAGKDVESITFENTYKPIEIPEKPELPKAGDDANLGLWLALFFISGGVLVGAGVYTAKARKNK